MKNARLIALLAAPLALAAAQPVNARAPQTTPVSVGATTAHKIVVKVGDPIIIKDKKPPKKK